MAVVIISSTYICICIYMLIVFAMASHSLEIRLKFFTHVLRKLLNIKCHLITYSSCCRQFSPWNRSRCCTAPIKIQMANGQNSTSSHRVCIWEWKSVVARPQLFRSIRVQFIETLISVEIHSIRHTFISFFFIFLSFLYTEMFHYWVLHAWWRKTTRIARATMCESNIFQHCLFCHFYSHKVR